MSVVGDLEVALQHYPVLMTVEEAAEVLRIGRSLAYEMARRYERSHGREGLPVIRVGSCLRVPRWALIELLATGLVPRLSDAQAVDRRLVDPDELARDAHLDGSQVSVDRQSFDEASSTQTATVRGRPRRANGRRTAKQLVLLPSDLSSVVPSHPLSHQPRSQASRQVHGGAGKAPGRCCG